MPIYLSDQERTLVMAQRSSAPLNRFYWMLLRDVAKRAATPGLISAGINGEWYHVTQDYIANAAMVYALQPDDTVGRWLRAATLSVVRRSVDDWVGPWFRDHQTKPLAGNLETASLSMAVAAAIDLAPGVFTADEQQEIRETLRNTAIPLITQWLDRARNFNNWRNAMTYGLAAAAVVLGDQVAVERAVKEYGVCLTGVQPDGSYSESLSYAGYAASSLSLTYESLVRYDPTMAQRISIVPYAKSIRWIAHSLFYMKPLSGWGAYDQPRFANFNDSPAIERLKPHWLPHIAARARDTLPTEAGLARWLFDQLYANDLSNNLSFLVLPLLAQAAAPISPEQAGLALTTRYSNGDAIARDAWGGQTVLAVRTGSDPLAAAGHLHGDVNSMILVHNRERLLLDSGHSCYRNLIRELDVASQTHNTCTFSVDPNTEARRPEELLVARVLQQSTHAVRAVKAGELGGLVDRGGRHLLTADLGQVKVIGSDAAALYGAPIEVFQRFWILCGAHALFVVDRIQSSRPVRTTWNWLLNNRDGELDLKIVHPDRLVMRRGDAGLKLFHLGGGAIQGPIYAYVHDDYNIIPNQPNEAKVGSGILMRWHEREPRQTRVVTHAVAVDDYGSIAGWHLRRSAEGHASLESPAGEVTWSIEISDEPLRLIVRQRPAGTAYQVCQNAQGVWTATELTA